MRKSGSITVAITGASGTVYGIRLVECLLKAGRQVDLLLSRPGMLVAEVEAGVDWKGDEKEVNAKVRKHFGAGRELTYHDNGNLFSPLASGSSGRGTMVIVPCSMGTLGRIAGGMSSNLIERAADVTLKEGGNLIVVPRETPLNVIHLENMLKLARTGAVMVPAMPGFYHRPKRMEDLVDFVVGKVLDRIGIEHDLFERWGNRSR